ncbi:MAG: DUF5681 domain-containing protein [Sedimenticola sp.]
MPFEKGKSGNPSGRPRGVQDKRRRYRALLDQHAPALIERAVELALEGDTSALKMCIDRILPTLKAQPLTVSIPCLENAETLADKSREVLNALSKGEITNDSALALLKAIETTGKIIETDELEARLQALESKLNDQSNAQN